MDDGDLVLAIISLFGLVAFVTLIAVDEWRHRTKHPRTPQAR
jgi:hypothetical protein